MILHAAELGQGPPLVLLHGLFGRSQNLAALARRLAARCRVISLDLRNHGASPHAPDMRYGTMADDVRQTLISRDAWPARVLGHSMGGKVAMMLALLHPRDIHALIVADIAPVRYAHGNRSVAHALKSIALVPGLTRAAADAALAPCVPEPAVRGFLLQNLVFAEPAHWRIGLADIADAIDDIEDWSVPVPGLAYEGPSWFITGGNSDFVLPEHVPLLKTMFPACQIMSVENAGHWLHADQPEAFASIVERVLI